MSQSFQIGSTECSKCSKVKQRFDVFIKKCNRHSYQLCTACNRVERGRQCPSCLSERGVGLTRPNNGESYQGNGGEIKTESSLQEAKLRNGELKTLMEDLQKSNTKNQDLASRIKQLELEKAQNQIQIKNIQIQKYKIKEKYAQEIQKLNKDNAEEIRKLQQNYQKQTAQLTERLQNQFKKKEANIERQNEDLKKKLISQKEEQRKMTELQINLLRTTFDNDKQKLLLQMQNKRNEDLTRSDTRQKQIRKEYEEAIQALKQKHQNQLESLKAKSEKQKQTLKVTINSQKELIISRLQQEKNDLQNQFDSEKTKLRQTYENQKGKLRGSYIDQKQSLEQAMEAKHEELTRTIANLQEEREKLKELHSQKELQMQRKEEDYKRIVDEKSRQIQRLGAQRDNLNSYIKTHDHSLDHYQKQIAEFEQYMGKISSNIIDQFKSLDETYDEPSTEKIKMTQMVIRQYKDIATSAKNPQLLRIVHDKQTAVTNYVATEMIKAEKQLQQVDSRDLSHITSERGRQFMRVVRKVDLFRSLQIQNINDNVDMYFIPKMLQKIKFLLQDINQRVISFNNNLSEFELIKQIDQFYLLRQHLKQEFPSHLQFCQDQYKMLNENITVGFKRFQEAYAETKENKPAEKLEDYLNKAEDLKKIIQVVNHARQYKKYTFYLEEHTGMKLEAVKSVLLAILNQNKKNLKSKLDTLMTTRVYYDCYVYQKIFKRLKMFDQILTKEENSFHNFNFTELFTKIVNFLRILKDEKINLCDVLITEQRINVPDLQKEFAGIHFDESLKNRYMYKLKTLLQNRNIALSKMNGNTYITSKHIEQIQLYHTQGNQLKTINIINELPQISETLNLLREKMILFVDFLELKFKEFYANTSQFKQIEETSRNVKAFYQFQTFVQKEYETEHQEFVKRIDPTRFEHLPKPVEQNQCLFSILQRLNAQNKDILNEITSSQDQPLKDEHFDYFTNLITYLPKAEGNKIQRKLHLAVLQYITQLESKEWLEGEVNSPNQRNLMFLLNKLQNKQIAYFRDIINIHKNRVLEERQKFINGEKRKLKEDNFENLQSFLTECQKHESSNSKFYKLYTNILEEYMNYSYDNIANDIEKKAKFLTNLYKLNIADNAKIVRQIIKSKEHKIYFNKPELTSIKENITMIQKFEGQNSTDVTNITEVIVNLIRLYAIYKANEEKTLLSDQYRLKLNEQVEFIINGITNNYLNLCKYLEHQKMFEEKCNRKKLFLDLIKIEIYMKIMKKCQQYYPLHEYYNNKGHYDQIVEKVNSRIEKVYEEVKQFRFYKDELKLQYDNNHFLFQHLKKIERLVQTFKDIRFKLFKFQDYLKNNYLDSFNLKSIDYKQLIRIMEMCWIKQYAMIKKEITELFASPQLDIVLKYKMILHEKQIVKNQNLLCFNQIIKEEYDFKRIIIAELMVVESKIERHLINLEKEYDSFTLSEKKLEQKKKICLQTEKTKIKSNYEKLIYDAKNSFLEIDDASARQKKIEAEVNTLMNQEREELQRIDNREATKMQTFRNKYYQKTDHILNKIFDSLLVIKKIQNNFDVEIEEVCKKLSAKSQAQIDKFDKGLKNILINYAKKSTNSDMILGLGALNLFKQINEEQFKLNTNAMNNIVQIIKKCPQTKNDDDLARKLEEAYNEYKKELERVEGQYYQTKSENKVLQLIKDTRAEAKILSPSVVVARIFAVYSIYRCIDSHQEEITFDGNPHIAQIVAILLLIDAQNGKGAKFGNRLIQVKTGEGKSRVLAGLNTYLALYGYDVYCGCYSSYLSQRDEEQFDSLFVRFGVRKMITYGPFSEHCEKVFNQGTKYNFKEITKKVLLNEELTQPQLEYLERLNKLLKRESRINRILVIDQVDVFFDEHYFGQIYAPGVAIDPPEIKKLIQFIWDHHTDRRLSKKTFESKEYHDLVQLFPHLKDLLKNQVQSMIQACNKYNIYPYEIRNNEIQYVDKDTVNAKLNFGYSTAFASCYEYERGKISEANYNKNINMSLIIGQFSYAELPKYFDHIMGVSGTVEAMSDFRKKIMREDYKIKEIYTLPSIYGDSHREIVGFHACNKSDYMGYLLERIYAIRKAQRPILVFFQTQQQLNAISSSPEFNQFTTSIYKITEKMPPEMRNPLINYAGTKNRITLISSAFSRGTDFIVYDSQINQKGGMYVIQTYISKNESDFIQILGRTGRQGKNGSFEMIVTIQDLQKNGIPLVKDKDLFKAIQESWKVNDNKHGKQLTKSIQEARKLHEITFQVVGNMGKSNLKLTNTVMNLNYNQIKGETIKTVIAIDGTGSMGAALNATLHILKDTIERCDEIINMKMPNVSFEHKIMIYRNYNTTLQKILEQSNFSKDPEYLKSFMMPIKPEGGLGNQALEILFYNIGEQLEYDKIDQIIVIGDAPANTYEDVVKHRNKFRGGEPYWSAKFPLLESLDKYYEKVKLKKVPVHSFYILRRKPEDEHIRWDTNVKNFFEDLSKQSQGQLRELNIRNKEEAKVQLTDFISERVLELIGGRDLIELYSKMFSKRYVN